VTESLPKEIASLNSPSSSSASIFSLLSEPLDELLAAVLFSLVVFWLMPVPKLIFLCVRRLSVEVVSAGI